MWILHFIPDSLVLWFCNILLIAGIAATTAGLFAHRIPGVWQYQLAFKIAGIALLVLGVYFRGGYAVEAEWRERVAEVRARLAQAEQAAEQANTVIENKAAKKITEIRNRTEYITRYIDREVVKYDSACVIPPSFVEAHNRAAEAQRK